MDRTTRNPAAKPWLLGLYAAVPIVLLALCRDLWAPDEPRYAEVAREAFQRELVVMHLNGEVYPDKPPLVYWLAGFCGQLAGWHEFALRLPSLVATLVTTFVAARFARARWGELEAAWTPLFFLGSVMVLEIGGRLQLDPVLTACCFGSVVLASDTHGTAAQRTRRIWLAGLLAGLGALAKGPVAWLHVGVGVLALRSASGPRASDDRGAHAPSAWPAWCGFAVLAVAPVLGWAFAAVARKPELAGALFFGQHVGRVVEGKQHPGPFWEHLAHFPLYFLPWTPLLVLALVRVWREWRARAADADRTARALALWFVVLFLVFSAMPPKRDLYLLPLYPVAALLSARALAQTWRAGRVLRGVWLPAGVTWCVLGVGGLAAVFLVTPERVPGWISDPERADDVLDALARVAPVRGWIAAAFACLAFGGAAACLRVTALRGRCADALGASLSLALCLLALGVVPAVNDVKSARSLATWLAARPERPAAIPCLGVQPEGYRFYGGVPAVKEDIALALARDGAQFLAVATQKEYARLPSDVRERVRVLDARSVGSRDVVVLGAR